MILIDLLIFSFTNSRSGLINLTKKGETILISPSNYYNVRINFDLSWH